MVTMDRSIAVKEVIAYGEEENPKTKHEDDYGDVTVLGRKERRMLQEEKFQKKDVLCRWQEEDTVKRCT